MINQALPQFHHCFDPGSWTGPILFLAMIHQHYKMFPFSKQKDQTHVLVFESFHRTIDRRTTMTTRLKEITRMKSTIATYLTICDRIWKRVNCTKVRNMLIDFLYIPTFPSFKIAHRISVGNFMSIVMIPITQLEYSAQLTHFHRFYQLLSYSKTQTSETASRNNDYYHLTFQ